MNNSFDKIYEDMKKQFPSCELKSKEKFLDLLKRADYKLNIYDYGYAFCFKSKFLLIDYIAIFKQYQSMGYGSKILKDIFVAHKALEGCFFEVEQINIKDVATIKRQEFYKRLGCKKLDFIYFFPNCQKEFQMDLFYYPLKNDKPSKENIFMFIQKFFSVIHKDVVCKDAILEKIRHYNFN